MGLPDMVTPCLMTMMPALNVERVVQHLCELVGSIWLFDLARRRDVANSRSSPSSHRPVWLAATTLGYTFATGLLPVAPLVHLRRRVLCL